MSSPERKESAGKDTKDGSRRGENLAMLYQGLLTGIVRMQAGRQHITDAASFRSRTQTAFQEVERDAVAAGYDGGDVRETHFAVAAFLDSVVLNSNEPVRAEWERRTLQEEMFGQTDAGVVFFEKLERLRARRDSQQLADVLEVYLLCILLGFEGRYSGGLRGELYSVEDRVRSRIDDLRGRSHRLSPSGLIEEPAPRAIVPTQTGTPYRLTMITAVIVTVLLYLAAQLQLMWASDQVRSKFF